SRATRAAAARASTSRRAAIWRPSGAERSAGACIFAFGLVMSIAWTRAGARNFRCASFLVKESAPCGKGGPLAPRRGSRLLRQRGEAANQVDEKPERNDRRQCGHMRRDASVVDQISAVERRVHFDPAFHGSRPFSPSKRDCVGEPTQSCLESFDFAGF